MRLVDADKTDLPVMQREDGEWVFRFTLKEMLDFLPTVDAIPVEWLKLKIDTVLNICPNGNEETEVLCKLLYEWEKENGI